MSQTGSICFETANVIDWGDVHFDPGRPAEISDAIVRLLRDDSLAERVGRAGRARVLQDFSLDALLAANEKFFHGAVQASTDRRGRAA